MLYLKIITLLSTLSCSVHSAYGSDYSEINEKLSIIYGKLEVLENKIDRLSKSNSSEKRNGKSENIAVQTNRKSSLVEERELAESETEEERSYKHMIQLIKMKKLDEAREQINSFAKTFPNSHLTSVGYHLLGEASFSKGEYKQASVDFLKSYKLNKNNDNTPFTLMKLVTSLRNIEQYEHACAIIKKLEKDYKNVNAIKPNLRMEKKALYDMCN